MGIYCPYCGSFSEVKEEEDLGVPKYEDPLPPGCFQRRVITTSITQ